MKIVELEGEKYYKIENHDTMRPFMSIVSDSDHCLFQVTAVSQQEEKC
jgi:hypothetical protein